MLTLSCLKGKTLRCFLGGSSKIHWPQNYLPDISSKNIKDSFPEGAGLLGFVDYFSVLAEIFPHEFSKLFQFFMVKEITSLEVRLQMIKIPWEFTLKIKSLFSLLFLNLAASIWNSTKNFCSNEPQTRIRRFLCSWRRYKIALVYSHGRFSIHLPFQLTWDYANRDDVVKYWNNFSIINVDWILKCLKLKESLKANFNFYEIKFWF